MIEKFLKFKNKIEYKNPYLINPKSKMIMQIRYLISTPFIYGMLIPMIIFHILIELYHRIVFSLYDIEYVDYKQHFIFKRYKLNKLTLLQKINCIYCEYGNGLASYIKSIIGKTEVYWCPIKNGRNKNFTHEYYNKFIDVDNVENFEFHRENMRNEVQTK